MSEYGETVRCQAVTITTLVNVRYFVATPANALELTVDLGGDYLTVTSIERDADGLYTGTSTVHRFRRERVTLRPSELDERRTVQAQTYVQATWAPEVRS